MVSNTTTVHGSRNFGLHPSQLTDQQIVAELVRVAAATDQGNRAMANDRTPALGGYTFATAFNLDALIADVRRRASSQPTTAIITKLALGLAANESDPAGATLKIIHENAKPTDIAKPIISGSGATGYGIAPAQLTNDQLIDELSRVAAATDQADRAAANDRTPALGGYTFATNFNLAPLVDNLAERVNASGPARPDDKVTATLAKLNTAIAGSSDTAQAILRVIRGEYTTAKAALHLNA